MYQMLLGSESFTFDLLFAYEVLNVVLFQQMQEAAGAELDATINQRQDLNVSTHEERKGGDVIDVR